MTLPESWDLACVCRAQIPTLGLVLPGCRVAHDGLADAGAIALWAWGRR